MPADPPRSVDLNADLGEEVTDDAGLLEVVTSANVACGFHAGTPATMRAVCAGAARRGVVVGAQVSYRDRAGFGRVARDVPYEVLRDEVAEQVATLDAIAREQGTSVRYVKPHGALYHRVTDDPEQAAAVLAGRGGCRCSASRGRASWRWPRRPAERRTSRGSPTAATATAGWSTAPSRVPCSRTTTRSRARPSTWPPGSRRCACTATRPDAVAHAHAVRRALEAAGYRSLRSFAPGPLTSPQATGRSCGGSGRSCGRTGPVCGGHAGPREFRESVGPSLLRGRPRRA